MKIWMIIATAIAALSTTAHATIVTFNYTAEQARTVGTPTVGTLTDTASAFNTISGTFSFDISTPDEQSDPVLGTYTTGKITVNEFTMPDGSTTTTTGNSYFNRDAMTIETSKRAPDNSFEFRAFINFVDFSETMLSSDALPTMLALSLFAGPDDIAEIGFNSARSTVYFDLASITSASEVPVPGAIPLLLSGLAGLSFASKKRRAA